MLVPSATTPGVSGVTPRRAASGLSSTEEHVGAEILFTGDQHPLICAHGLANPEFVDKGNFRIGLAAHAEHSS